MIVSFYSIGLISRARCAAALRVVRVYPVTCSTVPPVFSAKSVSFVEWMTANAVRLCSISTAKGIFNSRYRLKMSRVNTGPSSTEMIEYECLGKSPHEDSIRYSMRYWRLVLSQFKTAIAFFVSKSRPKPTWASVVGDRRIDTNFRKESSEKFSVGGIFVRIISEHLGLQLGLDGLGFRGLQHREALSF